jgi:hypothetical protein
VRTANSSKTASRSNATAPASPRPVVPDGQVRARVEAEQMRVSVAYYDHLPYTPDRRNPSSPCAYVWLGEPYDLARNRHLSVPELAGASIDLRWLHAGTMWGL